MVTYYPESFDISAIARKYPELEIVNEDEVQRVQDAKDRRKRGKGPPKKIKSKGELSGFLLSFFSMHVYTFCVYGLILVRILTSLF
jgi:hypothetical protein